MKTPADDVCTQNLARSQPLANGHTSIKTIAVNRETRGSWESETLGEKGDELKDTVTLRHRDSMKQERVAIKDLLGLILPQL